ncbi:MAG TPA: hypothetical protein VFP12_03160 [Allosphingosinicella sp.]|nr:hypothetical protein [Allosphingosinicella sp.]
MAANIGIGPSMSLAQLERTLADLPPESDALASVKLSIASGRETDLLADIWTAILCGTLCRRAETQVVYSSPDEGDGEDLRFAHSPAGLACASIAASIRSVAGTPLDAAGLRRRLMLENDGLVSPYSDVVQTLVEFDPDYPVSPLFLRSSGAEPAPRLRRRLFETQVLRFRQLLDLGRLRRGSGPVRTGPAGDVGRFLAELHENGLEHGSRGVTGTLSGTRLLRMRTHAAGHPEDLLERCGPFRQLRYYVERTFTGSDPVNLIEASISDFGMGIVDTFQASPAGLGPDVDRRDVLEGLIYDRLTSKSNDPSAGLGIQKALEAARSMQAFVSLRTAEFWMAASFLPDKPKARLVHLGTPSRPPVAGTHWQIFWPQP